MINVHRSILKELYNYYYNISNAFVSDTLEYALGDIELSADMIKKIRNSCENPDLNDMQMNDLSEYVRYSKKTWDTDTGVCPLKEYQKLQKCYDINQCFLSEAIREKFYMILQDFVKRIAYDTAFFFHNDIDITRKVKSEKESLYLYLLRQYRPDIYMAECCPSLVQMKESIDELAYMMRDIGNTELDEELPPEEVETIRMEEKVHDDVTLKIIQLKWFDIIEKVRTELDITEVSVKTWLYPLKPYKLIGSNLLVVAPEEIARDFVSRKFRFSLEHAIKAMFNKEINVTFVTRKLPSEISKTTA